MKSFKNSDTIHWHYKAGKGTILFNNIGCVCLKKESHIVTKWLMPE